MQVDTGRFGVVEVDPHQIVTFPEGLIGFSNSKRFITMSLLGVDESLKWLQSVDDPALGFITLNPRALFPGYDPEFCPKDLSCLGDVSPGDLIVLTVVTVPKDVTQTTANLQAPLVISPGTRLGKQVIVSSPEYTTRHSVFASLQSLLKRTG